MAKLKLQEKRRIENLVFDEINDALHKFNSKRSNEYDELKQRLIKNPPEPVKKLREEIVNLKNQIEAKQTELSKEGFELGYEDRLILREYGEFVNKELLAFSELTKSKRHMLEDMRKEFIVKIYADSDEVKDVFSIVSERIEKVIV